MISLAIGVGAGVLALLAVYRTFPTSAAQWIAAVVAGLLGGLLGRWLADTLGLERANWVGSLVVAFAGASLLLWLLRRAAGPPRGRDG